MSSQNSIFPAEIWMEILQYLPQETLVVVARVSPDLCEQARKLLLRNVVLRRPNPITLDAGCNKEIPPGLIHDVSKFHRMLELDTTPWRYLVRSAELEWTWEYTVQELHGVLSKPRKPVLDHTVSKVLSLLSETHHLERLHLTLPVIGVATALRDIPRITSLEFSLPYTYSWQEIHDIFKMPSLQYLSIKNLLSPDWPTFRFPPPIPDELHDKSGTSNVIYLTLQDGGPLTSAIMPLFSWLKDLKSLNYLPARSRCEPVWRGILRRTGNISDAVDQLISVLEPISNKIGELDFDLGLDRYWIARFQTRQLFESFTNLRRLSVPVEILMPSKGISTSRNGEPFYTRLPPLLRELSLKFTSQTPWHSRSGEQTEGVQSCVLDDHAHQLFNELGDLAAHKRGFYPELTKLILLDDCGQPSVMRCEHAQNSLELLRTEGVDVIESGWCFEPGQTPLLESSGLSP